VIVNAGNASDEAALKDLQAEVEAALGYELAVLPAEEPPGADDDPTSSDSRVWGQVKKRGGDLAWLVVALGLAEGWNMLTADCDGLVLVETLRSSGQMMWTKTQSRGGGITTTRRYAGGDTPWGCGGNSDYSVTTQSRHDH
jgi:hypothetical protein